MKNIFFNYHNQINILTDFFTCNSLPMCGNHEHQQQCISSVFISEIVDLVMR